jgi:hypothetical protein
MNRLLLDKQQLLLFLYLRFCRFYSQFFEERRSIFSNAINVCKNNIKMNFSTRNNNQCCQVNQISHFGYILEGPGMETVGMFRGHLEYITAVWYVLGPFGNLVVSWDILTHFGKLYQEKSGNPDNDGAMYDLVSTPKMSNNKVK